MNRAYSEAAVEILDILEHTAIEKVNLIPNKFINYLKVNAAKDYKIKLDYSRPINEMNIKMETKGILGTICRNWWWNDEEKIRYYQIVKEKQKQHYESLKKTYNTDNLFKNRVSKVETVENSVAMVEYKESFFTKIKNWFKRTF